MLNGRSPRLQGQWCHQLLRSLRNDCVLLAFFVLGGAIVLHPLQAAEWVAEIFDKNFQLPSAYVTALTLDREGRVVIGTVRGIAQYSGTELQFITVEDGLLSNEVSAVLVDHQGRMWIGHSNGRLTLGVQGQFREFRLPAGNGRNFPIISLYEDSYGNIWIGTLGNGVFIVGKTVRHLTTHTGLPGEGVFAVLEDSQHRFWIGTEQGIVVIPTIADIDDPSRWQYITTADGLPDNWVRCFVEDRQGTIWIGTRNGGVAGYQEVQRLQGKPLWRYINRRHGLPGNFVTQLFIDRKGNLWIGMYGSGVARWQRPGQIHVYHKRQGMPNLYVLDIIEDREGQIWVATFGGGLVVFHLPVIQQFTEKENLPSNNVLAILDDGKHFLWIATDAGLARIRYPAIPGRQNVMVVALQGQENEKVAHLLRDSTGNSWALTPAGDVYQLSATGGTLAFRSTIVGIVAAAADANSDLWILGQFHRLGQFSATGQRKRLWELPKHYGTPKWLTFHPEKGILVLMERGILQVRDNAISPIVTDLEWNKIEPTVIAVGPQGFIWIGTNGQGLYRIDTMGRIRRYATAQGLVATAITALYPGDDHQNLWIGTNRGFMQYYSLNGVFYAYTLQEGFPAIEVNIGAMTQDRYGNLWIGGVSGAYMYRFRENRLWEYTPDVVIKQVKLLSNDSVIANHSVLPYHANQLSFEVQGVSLRNPQALYYRYMLVGLDSAWSEPVKTRWIRYNEIPPGTYIFKVQAGYLYGQWSERPATFEFTILKPWWQTPWFYLSIVGGVVVLVSGGLWYRSYRMTKLNRWLEQEVAQRTAELVARTQELELVVRELQKAKQEAEAANEAKTKFLAKVTHELRTPLNIILGFSRRLLRKSAPALTPSHRQAVEAVYRNAEILLAHINSILQYARLEADSNVELEILDVRDIVRRVVEEFQAVVDPKLVTLQVQISNSIPRVYGNRQMIDQIIKNLLSNAVKFTPQGRIVVRVVAMDVNGRECVGIEVEDTGKGIPFEDQQRIFEPFQQATNAEDSWTFSGIGLGLSISKQLAVAMKGDLQLVFSRQGQGSCFRLVLPAVRDSLQLEQRQELAINEPSGARTSHSTVG